MKKKFREMARITSIGYNYHLLFEIFQLLSTSSKDIFKLHTVKKNSIEFSSKKYIVAEELPF